MKRLGILFALVLTLALALVGCGNDAKPAESKEAKEILIGATAGPHAEVVEFVRDEAKKQGINIKVVEFSDYIQPNLALENKELNANSYQHQPFLDNMVKDKGLHIVSTGKTILLPMGLYSTKYKNLADVPNGSQVIIPNDPTNGGRALLVLQQAGLIKLKDGGSTRSGVEDIVENVKDLKIKELEAAQIARSLGDTDLAAVNTNYALPAGLNPQKDALVVENADSPYANVFAVRAEDKDNETYKKILAIYQSEATRKFITEHFKGSILPAF